VRSYEEILAGRGFGIDAVRPSIEIASAIRSSPIEPGRGEMHPFAAKYVQRRDWIPGLRSALRGEGRPP